MRNINLKNFNAVLIGFFFAFEEISKCDNRFSKYCIWIQKKICKAPVFVVSYEILKPKTKCHNVTDNKLHGQINSFLRHVFVKAQLFLPDFQHNDIGM